MFFEMRRSKETGVRIRDDGFTPTFTLSNLCFAGFAIGEIEQGEPSPLPARAPGRLALLGRRASSQWQAGVKREESVCYH